MKVHGTVTGKHAKPVLFGLLGRRPYISIEWTDPSVRITPRFADYPIRSFAVWDSLAVGDELLVTMDERGNRLYPRMRA